VVTMQWHSTRSVRDPTKSLTTRGSTKQSKKAS
jgi:hypothetical protein